MEIIGVIVAGIIIGLLGNIVALSTRNNLPLWLTIICGLSGAIIGWFSYYSRFVNHRPVNTLAMGRVVRRRASPDAASELLN